MNKNTKKIKYDSQKILIGICLTACLVLCSVILHIFSKKQEVYRESRVVMNTTVSYQLYGKNQKDAVREMSDLLKKLENDELSWRKKNSFVSKVNLGKKVDMTEKENEWMKKVISISDETKAAFDPTIGKLIRLWNIEGKHPKVPERQLIFEAKESRGTKYINIDGDKIKTENGILLDLGAAGKGIACDEIAAYLKKEENIKAGVVAVGGSLAVYGTKPEGKWQIGIQNPRAEDGEILGVLAPEESCFISTSGDYEKYFMENGERYHHILDGQTGYPAKNGLISVSIIGNDGCLTDALSTACFVAGLEKGIEMADHYKVGAIFVTDQKKVILKNVKQPFSLVSDEYKIEEDK